jgi:hypothetical protein
VREDGDWQSPVRQFGALTGVVRPELSIRFALFDEARRKGMSSLNCTSLPHMPGRISNGSAARACSADITMLSASGLRNRTRNCAWIEFTAMLPLQTGPLMNVPTSYSASSRRNW